MLGVGMSVSVGVGSWVAFSNKRAVAVGSSVAGTSVTEALGWRVGFAGEITVSEVTVLSAV